MTRSAGGSASTRRTVLVAGAANVLVAVAKLVAGLMTGSSAMLAETAHSVADTLNQAFLLTSLHQGDRPADERHPFGHGQERYFRSLLAALGIFIAGALFSVFEGVLELHRSGDHDFLIAYVVLAVAFAAEGTSLMKAYRQVRGEARASGTRLVDHVRSSPDITVKAALFSADRVEDLADDIDRRLAEKLPVVPHVFIDPTQTSPGRDPAARQ
jgi:cation diffusion facilitator family transporter